VRSFVSTISAWAPERTNTKMRAITLLLIAPACVLGFGFGFDLRPISGSNRLAAVRPMGRALFMAADASPEATAVEAETLTKAAADATADKTAADKKAAAEAEAEKAKAEAEAEKAKAEAEAEKAKAEAEAEAAAQAAAEAAEAAAEAEREAVKAEAKRELEAELQAARAPRPRVQVGDELPAIKVTRYTKAGKGGKLTTAPLAETMGKGTTIIVGMPGAFTPTCTDKHLPGLLASAAKFGALNVSKVAVLTTNDGFVNNGWVTLTPTSTPTLALTLTLTLTLSRNLTLTLTLTRSPTRTDPDPNPNQVSAVEACCGSNASGVTMLSDTSGELVEALGLAGDIGVGLEP
jgi:hypothetical protein